MREITEPIAKQLKVKTTQVEAVLNLLADGATLPFIARYRKEMTGALDEEEIRLIQEQYNYQVNLAKRKEDVLRLIEEKGKLTEEIKAAVAACEKLSQVDDIYRPYQEKRKTRAKTAIENGLEPLAKWLLSCPISGDVSSEASK